MTRRHGGALLSAIIALVVGLSAAIYVSVASDHGPGRGAREAALAAAPGPGDAAPISTGVWVGSWAAAPVGGEPGTATDGTAGRTVRTDGVFDEVVDFDEALSDPYDPRSLRPEYDSGDHLHPSDRGYRKIAETVGLATLKGSAPAQL